MMLNKEYVINLWILLLTIPAMSWAAEMPCSAPTELVRVIAKQNNENPPTYSYLIKNLHKLPITIFALSLGDSDHEEMYSVQDNIPKTFVSPKGWKGGVSYTDESVFMRIFWKTTKPTTLESGQSLGGFEIMMPLPVMKKGETHNLYGTPIQALDMRKVPFNVFFEKAACVWGRVQEQENKVLQE